MVNFEDLAGNERTKRQVQSLVSIDKRTVE